MVQDNYQPVNGETDDWVFSSGISVGVLLKEERERKGLTHEEICEQTRLRPHVLKTLENEEWEKLSGPTLVKGFIRSYARALGLDAERIVTLYQGEATSQPLSEAFVLPSVQKRRKWPVFLIVALLLVAVAAGFYFFKEDKGPWEKTSNSKSGAGTETVEQAPTPVDLKAPDPVSEPIGQNGVALKTPQDAELKRKPFIKPSRENSLEPGNVVPPAETPAKEAAQSSESGAVPLKKQDTAVPAESPPLSLTGHITERTWLQISIDGGEAKEFFLMPKDRPRWSAKVGFELLIGNAGGIVLEFNGKKLDHLGKQGQVVRVKLPPDDQKKKLED